MEISQPDPPDPYPKSAQTVPSLCRAVTSDAARLLLTSGVVSPTSSSRRNLRPMTRSRAARNAAVNLVTSGVGASGIEEGSVAAATGVRVTPETSTPGGRVTSARHVGHCSIHIFSRKRPTDKRGLTSLRHFNNHSSHSSLWKTCPHGNIRTISPLWKASIQIAHSSFEKYFFPVDDFVRSFWRSEVLAAEARGSGTGMAGGVRISAGEMGGGASVATEREVGVWSESSESSFSQTMSGVQIRSGRERTTSGGARSASRCLNELLDFRTLFGFGMAYRAIRMRCTAIVARRKSEGIRSAKLSRLLSAL